MGESDYIWDCDCLYCRGIRAEAEPHTHAALARLDAIAAKSERKRAAFEAIEQRRREYPDLFAREAA